MNKKNYIVSNYILAFAGILFILFYLFLSFNNRVADEDLVIFPVIQSKDLFGFVGWFLGELNIINISDFIVLISRFVYTSGFIVIGILTLYRKRLMKELHYLILAAFTMGLILAVANSIAFFKAITNRELKWYCTPKSANYKFIKNENS